MAFEEYDDYEQSERVQQWLRQNGASIAVGVVLGLLLIFGWQQWKSHRANHREAASTQYQLMQKELAAGKTSEADATTDTLLKDYDDTAYAVFAATLRAKRELDGGHADKADASLTWALNHAGNDALKSLTAVRLARVELTEGKADASLSTLKGIPAKDYRGLVEELRGDALVKLGRTAQARSAYQSALSDVEQGTPQSTMLQVKIDNLPVVPETATAKPATTGMQGA